MRHEELYERHASAGHMRAVASITAIALILSVLTGCAHVPKDFGTLEVQAQAKARTTTPIAWGGTGAETPALAALLEKPLTPDSAVQIALLRNPEVAIISAELGLSRADLIEAGTLPNPSLAGMVRFGAGTASGTMVDLDGGFPLLGAITLPLRRKIEEQHFERAKLLAADRFLALVAQVRAAWYDAVAAQQELDIVTASQEAASAAADLARRQYQAGNLSRLELLSHETLEAQTRLEVRALKAAVVAREQELRRVMGLQTGDPDWMLMPVMPPGPPLPLDAAVLESAAVERRLDLAAAEHRVAAMEKGLRMAKRFRFTGLIDVGVSAQRESEGDWFVGPSLDLEIPLFDRKRGNVARFEALVAMARAERDAAQAKALADIRTTVAAMQSAADRVTDYDTNLLPLQHEMLEQTLLHYNGMLLGVYDVLNAKRMEIEAERGALRARLDYWLARTNLERAVAGPIPTGETPGLPNTTPIVEKPVAPHDEHHHHQEN